MNLDFLKNVELKQEVKKTVVRTSVDKLPVNADLRLFKNGKIYPSAEFAAAYRLDFVPSLVDPLSGATTVQGNGLDIFSSDSWGMYLLRLYQRIALR